MEERDTVRVFWTLFVGKFKILFYFFLRKFVPLHSESTFLLIWYGRTRRTFRIGFQGKALAGSSAPARCEGMLTSRDKEIFKFQKNGKFIFLKILRELLSYSCSVFPRKTGLGAFSNQNVRNFDVINQHGWTKTR